LNRNIVIARSAGNPEISSGQIVQSRLAVYCFHHRDTEIFKQILRDFSVSVVLKSRPLTFGYWLIANISDDYNTGKYLSIS
ncbi:MAG: hypothetical protein QME51_11780, partial [Planctomycetota bacterium]|nr:hypothetical protein [Planctomycetota bacterium]